MKICHISDIHLGYRKYNRVTKFGINQREADINLAFREAVDRIIRLRPDIVLITGDIFHTVRPSNNIVTFCFKELRRLTDATKSPVVMIAGNHDTPKRVDTGCLLKLFSEIPNIYVADVKQERFAFPELELSVFALPHNALSKIDEIELRADDNYKINIMMTHGQIEERWMSEFGGITVEHKKLKPHEWDYIALGHVHVPRQVGNNGWYAGSIEHTSSNIWAEASENKGFLEVTLPNLQVRVHSLTSPREVVLIDTIDGHGMSSDELLKCMTERLDSVSGGIEGKLVKLEVHNVPSNIYRQLQHKELRRYRSQALHLQLEIKSPKDYAIPDTSLVKGRTNMIDIDLKRFISEHTGINTNLKNDVKSLMDRYIQKLSEENEVTST